MPDPQRDHDQFMRLFIPSQPRLYAYIRTLVFNRADAEELLQEVAAVLWRKFDEFEPGSHFDRWAYTIARNQILYHRQKCRRDALIFNSDVMEMIADDTARDDADFDAFRDALSHCVARLSHDDRDLLRRRYEPDATNRSVAGEVGRSESAVSRALHRMYRTLLECIRRRTDAPAPAPAEGSA